MAQYSYIDFDIQANNVTLVNCISNETGNWDPTHDPDYGTDGLGNLSGYGIKDGSSNSNTTLKHCNVFNAGADSFFMLGTNCLREYCNAYADKYGNSTDYMHVIGNDNHTLKDCGGYRYVDRDGNGDLPHHSRSLAVKYASSNHLINDFTNYNTRVMIYQDCFDIEINRGTTDCTNENGFVGQFIIANQCNNVVVNDHHIIRGAVSFSDYSSEGYGYNGTGSPNTFNRLTDRPSK